MPAITGPADWLRFLTTGLHPQRRDTICAAIADMSRPTAAYYVLVVLSTAIAAYGLLANSTAVVIGAMLVAPLMGDGAPRVRDRRGAERSQTP
jgi:hypothetical protein